MESSSSKRSKKREQLTRDARMQRILEASRRIFAQQSYDEISIDDIAAAASMSKGLLYHYFSTKRELYLELLQQELATMKRIAEDTPDFHTCLSALLSFIEQSPAKQALRGGLATDPEILALMVEDYQQQLPLLLRHLGRTEPSPLDVLVLRGWSGFFYEVCMEWIKHPTVSREQVLLLLERSFQALLSSAM